MIPQRCINALDGLAENAPIHLDTLSTLRSATALVRTSANLSSGEGGQAALMILAHDSFPKVLNNLLHASHPHLREEAHWLGLTFLCHSSQEVVQTSKILGIDKIVIAKDHDHVPIQTLAGGQSS